MARILEVTVSASEGSVVVGIAVSEQVGDAVVELARILNTEADSPTSGTYPPTVSIKEQCWNGEAFVLETVVG